MSDHRDAGDAPAAVSKRTMEIVVALVMIAGSAITIYDSNRVGFGWVEGEGPAPGYFPFWVAVILGGSSLVILLKAIASRGGPSSALVSTVGLKRILSVLIPAMIYVALIGGVTIGPLAIPGLGIYVASALYIAGFMLLIGGDTLLRSLLVSVGVPLTLFMMFERWFIVPLPKGPLEAMLGFG